MGSPISQVASSTQPQGKGGYQAPRPRQNGFGSNANFAESMDMRQIAPGLGMISPAQQPGPSMDQMAVPAVTEFGSGPTQSYMDERPSSMDMPPAGQPTGQPSQGKGSRVTYPGQGGQPKMGQPNMYPNTVGQWDNASIQPQQSRNSGGKGKG